MKPVESRYVVLGVAALAGLIVAVTCKLPVARADADVVAWQEHFAHTPLDWADPLGRGPVQLARVYSTLQADGISLLHAHHDATVANAPPALHMGHALSPPVPLERVRFLRWKWRVGRHPNVAPTDDAWLDAAASVYVVFRQPSLFSGGEGFKFAWLSKPGAAATRQRGLRQVELRHDVATRDWKEERVDVCALYRRDGACEGQFVRYIGVLTDADGSKSVADADYADFELVEATK